MTTRTLVTMADILALQIEGILHVQDETQLTPEPTSTHRETEVVREAVQFLFATDQTLRTGVHVRQTEGALLLEGEVTSAAQKNWAEQVAESAGGQVQSHLKVSESSPEASTTIEPPLLDDESLQALVLFRLRLVRETEHLPVRVKANRGIVVLQGKVRTEALRQRVETSPARRSASANCAAPFPSRSNLPCSGGL